MHGPEAARIMREELNYRGAIIGGWAARSCFPSHNSCCSYHRHNWQCAARGHRLVRVQRGQPSGHQAALQGEADGRTAPPTTHRHGSSRGRKRLENVMSRKGLEYACLQRQE